MNLTDEQAETLLLLAALKVRREAFGLLACGLPAERVAKVLRLVAADIARTRKPTSPDAIAGMLLINPALMQAPRRDVVQMLRRMFGGHSSEAVAKALDRAKRRVKQLHAELEARNRDRNVIARLMDYGDPLSPERERELLMAGAVIATRPGQN